MDSGLLLEPGCLQPLLLCQFCIMFHFVQRSKEQFVCTATNHYISGKLLTAKITNLDFKMHKYAPTYEGLWTQACTMQETQTILFFSHGKSPVVWKTWGWWAWLTRRVCSFSRSAQIPSLFYSIRVWCAVFVQLWFFWDLDGI